MASLDKFKGVVKRNRHTGVALRAAAGLFACLVDGGHQIGEGGELPLGPLEPRQDEAHLLRVSGMRDGRTEIGQGQQYGGEGGFKGVRM